MIPYTENLKDATRKLLELIKETQDLYAENNKTLMKEIKDDTNRCRDIPCSWIERINIVKMTTVSRVIFRFNAVLSNY